MPKVSVLIPSRNERFLPQTVADVLSKARGDIEVIVCLDGYWPDPPLPTDKRLRTLHRGTAQGMRPGINAMTRMAKGEYFLKTDGHCLFDEGFDVELATHCDRDWIVVPRRYALDPEAWAIKPDAPKYPIDYHYLSYPWERPGDPACGLHGTEWRKRREARKHLEIDEEMSSQGSCWFMSRAHWERLGEMDDQLYGSFISEFQELGLKTWLGGGKVMVNKRTHYAHLHKGTKWGRGYSLGQRSHHQGKVVEDFWMFDRWDGRTHNLSWLIERFAPVPGWPANWQEEVEKRRANVAA